jgi:hypothetical protein
VSGVGVGGIGLPAALPADIRSAPKARQDAYRGALGFEQVLVQQLAEEVLPKDAAGAYANLLPQAFADGLTAAGGLGLARTLTDGIAPETSS